MIIQNQMAVIVAIPIVFIFMIAFCRHVKRKYLRQDQQCQWRLSYQNSTTNKNTYKTGSNFSQLKRQQLSQINCLQIGKFNNESLKKPQVIPMIQDLNFLKLNRLYLYENNIQSIEPLASIRMPNLQVLGLSRNNIIEIRGFRKLQSQNLIWIQLNDNPIKQKLSSLAEIKADNLQYIWIQFFINQKKFNQDLSWLAKCQFTNLQKIHLKNTERIQNNNIIQAIKRKFLKLQIRLSHNS